MPNHAGQHVGTTAEILPPPHYEQFWQMSLGRADHVALQMPHLPPLKPMPRKGRHISHASSTHGRTRQAQPSYRPLVIVVALVTNEHDGHVGARVLS